MATLPRPTVNLAPNPDQRIIRPYVAPADVAIGQALQGVGQEVFGFAADLQKAKSDAELVEADMGYRMAMAKERSRIEKDPSIDPETIPATIAEAGERYRGEFSKKIKGQERRDGWIKKREFEQVELDDWASSTSLQRQKDKRNAEFLATIEGLDERAGDTTVDRAVLEKDVEAQKIYLKTLRDKGIVDETEAERRRIMLDNVLQRDHAARVTSRVDELVSGGYVRDAKAYLIENGKGLDPKTRDALLRGVEEAGFDNDVIREADKVWEKAGGVYGSAVRAAAGIDNPRLRTEVEKRLAVLRGQADATREEEQDALQQRAWSHVEAGGTIATLPASVRSRISPEKLSSIRTYESARDAETVMNAEQREQRSAFSKNAADVLKSLPPATLLGDPGKMPPEVRAYYGALTPSDLAGVLSDARTRMANGGKLDTVTALSKDLVAEARRIAPNLSWGGGKELPKGKALQVEGALRQAAQQYATETGGQPLTTKAAREIVARALNAVDAKAFTLPADIGIEDTLSALGPEKLKNMDPDVLRPLVNRLSLKLGRAPTAQQLEEAYRELAG